MSPSPTTPPRAATSPSADPSTNRTRIAANGRGGRGTRPVMNGTSAVSGVSERTAWSVPAKTMGATRTARSGRTGNARASPGAGVAAVADVGRVVVVVPEKRAPGGG